MRDNHNTGDNAHGFRAGGNKGHQRQLLKTLTLAEEITFDSVGIWRVDFGRQDDVIGYHGRGEPDLFGCI